MNKTTETAPATNPFALPSEISIMIIGIFGVITNGTLLIVMILDPLKCFRRPSMYFVLSLAISDLFTSITSCLFAVQNHVTSEFFSKVLTSVIWASVVNSFVTILSMAIERFIVVRYPIKAKSIITTRRILIAITVTWVISLVSGAGVSFPPPYNEYVQFGCLLECFVIILVMFGIYLRILVLLKKSSKIFRAGHFTRHRHRNSEQGKRRNDVAYQRSLNMVVFYLALVLIITVLPHLILGQIYLGYKFFYPTHSRPESLLNAPYISFPIELLNFVLNPVIYAYRLPQFRAALCYYFKKKTNRPRAGSDVIFSRERNLSNRNHCSYDTMI